MKKVFKIGFLVGLLTVFMVGGAFAGTARVNNVGAGNLATIAVETLGAARNFTYTGVGAPTNVSNTNAALTYTITQNLTSGNLIRVVLAGAAFDGSTINVGAFNSGTANEGVAIATGTPPAGSTTFNFQINLPVTVAVTAGGNNYVWFTNGAIIPVVAAAAANVPFQFPTTTGAGSGTATIDIITSGGIAVDAASTVTIANIAQQSTPSITTRAMVIDYLVTPFNGTLFTTASTGATAVNVATNVGIGFNIAWGGSNYTIGAAGQNAGLTSSAVVTFDAATDWTGVSRVWLGAGSTALAANISNVVTSPTGAAALNWSTASYNQTVVADVPAFLAIEVDGSTNLQSRTVKGKIDITVAGTGAQSPASVSGNFQTWTPNGYQAYVPHMRYDPSNSLTFVRLVNNSTTLAADLIGTIRQADGTVINNADLVSNTIPAGQTVTLSASAIGAANGLGTSANFALQITGLCSADQLYANGYFNYNSGGVWTTRDISIYDSQKTAAVVK